MRSHCNQDSDVYKRQSLRDDKELYAYVMPFTVHTLVPVKLTFKSYVELLTKYGFLKPVLNTCLLYTSGSGSGGAEQ